MFNKFVGECKILMVSLAVGLVFATVLAVVSYAYSHAVQRDISQNVIRFHVRANSDTAQDQQLKDMVRVQVLARFEEFLAESMYIEETRQALQAKLTYIQEYAEGIVRAAGFAYNVDVQMANMFFPTQFYGNIVFPPGQYEAVKIIIGAGEGRNWWCLMFPPLCYLDMTTTDSGRELLAGTIADEGFRLITHPEDDARNVAVRFRVVEWWQNRSR